MDYIIALTCCWIYQQIFRKFACNPTRSLNRVSDRTSKGVYKLSIPMIPHRTVVGPDILHEVVSEATLGE